MRRQIILVAGALAAALVVTGAVIASRQSPPPTPDWVAGDGRVVPEKAPAFFTVAGPDGRTVVCANGRALKVRAEVGAPRFDPRTGGPPPVAATEPLVPRCGQGARPDLNPVFVPVAQDPLRQK